MAVIFAIVGAVALAAWIRSSILAGVKTSHEISHITDHR